MELGKPGLEALPRVAAGRWGELSHSPLLVLPALKTLATGQHDVT